MANFVLHAIHNEDVDAIICTFNQTNRYKFDPATDRENLRRFLLESKADVGKVREVTEVRIRQNAYSGNLAAICYIRQVDDEIFVVTLTLENGEYCFEDINSPSVEMYNKLELLKTN